MYWLLTSAGKIFSGGRYVDDVGKKKKKKKSTVLRILWILWSALRLILSNADQKFEGCIRQKNSASICTLATWINTSYLQCKDTGTAEAVCLNYCHSCSCVTLVSTSND